MEGLAFLYTFTVCQCVTVVSAQEWGAGGHKAGGLCVRIHIGYQWGPLLSVCMFVQVAMATGGGAARLHALIHADIGGVVEGL